MIEEEQELNNIRKILEKYPKGLTILEISKKIPLSRASTAKYLNTLLISGHVEMRTYGRAKIYNLSQRVPISNLLSLSSDLILLIDKEFFIQEVNNPLLEVFHLKRTDVVGRKIDFTPLMAYLSPRHLERIRNALKGNEKVIEEVIEVGDEEYFFRIKLLPIVFDRGEKGIGVIFEDITELKKYQLYLEQLVEERTMELLQLNKTLLYEVSEHKKSKKLLKRSEEKYRELVENSNSLIVRLSKDAKVQFVNEYTQSFFGIDDPELVTGHSFSGVLIKTNSKEGDVFKDQIGRSAENPEQETSFKIENTDGTGRKRFIAWTIKPIFNKKGIPGEYLCVGVDITERTIYENKYIERGKILNIMADQLEEMVYYKDKDFRYTFLSEPYSMNIFLSKKDECSKKTDIEIISELKAKGQVIQFEKIALDSDKKAKESHTAQKFETKIIIDKIQKILEVTKTPYFNDEGEFTGIIGSCRDVTGKEKKND